MINLLLRLFNQRESNLVGAPVSKDEIKRNLLGFKKSKSHGPDDWMVKFFIGYFDLMVDDLVIFIEEA